MKMAKLVKVKFDPEAERKYMDEASPSMPSTVRVVTKYGLRFEKLVESPKGSPENPCTVKELEEKFSELASTVIESKDSTRIIHNIQKLERLDNIFKLTRLLAR